MERGRAKLKIILDVSNSSSSSSTIAVELSIDSIIYSSLFSGF